MKNTKTSTAAAGIKAAHEALRKIREGGGKPVRRDPIEKAAENPKSMRLAVTAKCYDCQGGDSDPCHQWRIGNCTAPTCPLWPVRPYQRMYQKPMPATLKAEGWGD